jgi:GT2 family glycosyltransferase
MTARLAIVIVNFNGERLLPACLEALRGQTWRDFRVIVVDNASTDAGVSLVRALLPAAEVIRNPVNLGFAHGNDLGVARALEDPGVEYVLALNNDTIPASDFLECLVAAADRSPPDYGSWQGKVVSAADPRLLDAVGLELTRDSVATQIGHQEVDAGRYGPQEVYGVNAAAALYSRRFIEDVMVDGEFFDHRFFAYLEDVDVAVRGVSAGWRAAFVADAVVRHVGSATGGTASALKWRRTSANRLFLAAKNYSWRELAVSAGPSLGAEARLLLGFARARQRDLLVAYPAARAGAVLALGPMLRKRRAIRRRRVAPTIFAPRRPVVAPATGQRRLSVVIPTWNGRHELEGCLAALRTQTLGNLEVVVVDNGSSDGTAAYVRRHHPEAIVVPLAVNIGFAGGANAGIKATSGAFIALLNNDAIADPRWAEELLAAMDHADIAASLILRHDAPELVDTRGEALSRWGLPYRSGRGERADGLDLDGYPPILAASGGASIYRRTTLEAIGVFDQQYFAYLEDVDLGLRARLAGYRIVLAPRARVLHKVGATASKLGPFQLHQLIKNSQLLVLKNLPLTTLVKMAPRLVVVQAHLFVAAVHRRAGWSALRAHAAVAGSLPVILVKRWRVRRLRRRPRSEIESWLTDEWPLDTNPREKARALLARVRRRPPA